GLPGQSAQDRPVDLVLSPDGKTLAVETNYGVAVLPAGAEPGAKDDEDGAQFFPSAAGNIAGVAFSADGRRIYASALGDRAGRAPRPGDPLQLTSPGWPAEFPIVVDPATGIAAEGSVSVVDAETLRARAEIRTGRLPGLMALSPDGASLYVPNANDDTVS